MKQALLLFRAAPEATMAISTVLLAVFTSGRRRRTMFRAGGTGTFSSVARTCTGATKTRHSASRADAFRIDNLAGRQVLLFIGQALKI